VLYSYAMHYELIITCDKKHATSSREVREYAFSKITNKQLLVDADSFVIGGRYSGELSRTTWAKEIYKEIKKRQKKEKIIVRGAAYPTVEEKEKQSRLRREVEALYNEAIPEQFKNSGLKYDRNEFRDYGYDDDAMVVTKELYNCYLKEYEGLAFKIDKESESLQFVDLNGKKVDSSYIGGKWLLIGDYLI
jgi:hypothetical protein